jgi:conjugative relaxase-like TrwC/TraI family protein
MLTMKPQSNLVDAKKYFEEHFCVGDYYMEGQSVSGKWFGKGAEDLGLTGMTRAEDFLRLCDNLHPQTGERLTQRQNTTRVDLDAEGKSQKAANRWVFFDFTLSPPKSVSIAALVGDDQRIVAAHDEAATLALRQLEFYAATRVRKKGQTSYRTTGNLVGAVFRHDTSRALDPHLHSHCILFNATKDSVENCWKALEPYEMLVAKKFVENLYYHELVRALNRFGYRVQNKPRGDFDIEDVPPELIKRFSKRHEEIDRKTAEMLNRQPEKAGQNINQIREHIAHKERARKIKNVGLTRLQSLWHEQMSDGERTDLQSLSSKPPISPPPKITAEQAVTWAEEHLFERHSVVREHDLWRHALEHARGQNIKLAEIQSVTKRCDYVRDTERPDYVASREGLEREWAIVKMARDGCGEFHPLNADFRSLRSDLDCEQREALEKILLSCNFMTLFRGGAGTGKSHTLREVVAGLHEGKRNTFVIAPQRQQVLGLENDGFREAETVSAFLLRESLPSRSVVLVDEAGQIGVRQMLQLLEFVQAREGRIILSGDTRQHGAVEAGDAFRVIEKYGEIPVVELTTIRRQNPALAKTNEERKRIKQYRQAVSDAQAGKITESFQRLEKMNAIVTCPEGNKQERLADTYVARIEENNSCVVVSQTWAEIHRVNEAVRAKLKAKERLGATETSVMALEQVDLTDAQKRDPRFYAPESVLVFNRDTAGFKTGSSGKLLHLTDRHLLVEAEGRIRPIPLKHVDRVSVCREKTLVVSAGERLQLKANARDKDGRKLANGELVTVREILADGRIALVDGRTLPASYRQFTHGYAVTSYAAQGKTVDHVLFSDSTSRPATSAQQWYVTISRGRKGISIFTSDPEQLRTNITRSGERPLAMELRPAVLKRSWFYKLVAKRFGERAANIFDRAKRHRKSERLREWQTQVVQQTQTKGFRRVTQVHSKSHGVGV